VTHIEGWTEEGRCVAVRLTPPDSPAANYAFDVTPARLVTALITERGICPASREGSSNCSRSGGGGSLENSAGEKGSGWTTQPSGTERRLEIF
jgi:methylthioribose-1-phosphate isomerase